MTKEPVLNPLGSAAELLYGVTKRIKKPLIMVMHPQKNHQNLSPGEVLGVTFNEVRPDCDGLVFAVAGSPEEVQELLDMVTSWVDRKKKSDLNG